MWSVFFLLALASERMEVVQGTTAARSETLEVHGGGLVVRDGEAGVAFSSLRVGKGKRQPAFVIVFRHNLLGEGKSEFDDSCSADEAKAEARQAITVNGKAIRIEYKATLDPRSKRLARETLTVNGETVDLTRGRVLLVDLEATAVTTRQRKIDLPTDVDAATGRKAAAILSGKLLAHLRGKDNEVRKFLDLAAGK